MRQAVTASRAMLLSGLIIVLGAVPAHSQLALDGDVGWLQPPPVLNGPIAYDPVNKLYLVTGHSVHALGLGGFAKTITLWASLVSCVQAMTQPICASSSTVTPSTVGSPLGRIVTIQTSTNDIGIPAQSVVYSPDIIDSAGLGGFLITWLEWVLEPGNFRSKVYACALSSESIKRAAVTDPTTALCPSRRVLLEDRFSFDSFGATAAYSNNAREFLIAWRTLSTLPQNRIAYRRVGLDAQPLGPVIQTDWFTYGDIGTVWNPTTNQFAVAFPSNQGGSPGVRLVRLGPAGVVVGDSFHTGGSDVTGHLRLVLSPSTGHHLIVYDAGRRLLGLELDGTGGFQSQGRVSDLMSGINALALAHNPVSDTLLAIAQGSELELRAIELNARGAPLQSSELITTFATFDESLSQQLFVAARTDAPEWLVAFKRGRTVDFTGRDLSEARGRIIKTATFGSGSRTTLDGCVSRDPFIALGGGFCLDGGWLPPGIPPPPASCSTPDPFVAFGGGTCARGGWYPPGVTPPGAAPPTSPAPTPPPSAPSPGGCLTPDPFTALGGGTCSGGGWYPPGITPPGTTPPPSPPSAPSTCVGTDPFVAIGGGVCIGGGWIPRTMISGG